ncbi:CLUMA_CG021017, isoform A [Clunio marinus]|uniref:small monomeric GTPase n=1 Tax=Clunio marinus TaxID=568069 RepID=A0A1J1J6Z2_9DIPT|nr:CLUMA_CG021017, isoform A [Clunio marinus]
MHTNGSRNFFALQIHKISLKMNSVLKTKIAVCGSKGVGKSAITVRYLTKRFISEYSSSNDFLYKHDVTFEDNTIAEIEILDASNQGNSFDQIRWGDSFIVVYSIVDRDSFKEAEKILKKVTKIKLPSYYTVLLLGNKNDLEHSREVAIKEGERLSYTYNCQFYETSAAESWLGVQLSFHYLFKEARAIYLQKHLPIRRKLGVNTVGVNFSKALGNIFGKTTKSDRKRPSLSI